MSAFVDDIPDMKPGDKRTYVDGDHVFTVTATSELGCDTGRRRYRVECVSCQDLVHEDTTGPRWNMGFHVRETARSQRR